MKKIYIKTPQFLAYVFCNQNDIYDDRMIPYLQFRFAAQSIQEAVNKVARKNNREYEILVDEKSVKKCIKDYPDLFDSRHSGIALDIVLKEGVTQQQLEDELLGFIKEEDLKEVHANYSTLYSAHWALQESEYVDDDGELTVYVTAKCPRCDKPWHNNHTICSERTNFYRYHDETEILPEKEKEACREEVRNRIKAKKYDLPRFCEFCGIELGDGVLSQKQ